MIWVLCAQDDLARASKVQLASAIAMLVMLRESAKESERTNDRARMPCFIE
jgi:hypothetical protein